MTMRAYDHYLHTGSTVYGSEMLMGNLRSIVMQCLVHGSGGVPGAGWTIEYDAGGTLGTFVLGNEPGDFFICFHRVNSSQVRISIAATFEGVGANGLIQGEAARSGLAGNSSAPHVFSHLLFLGGNNATDSLRSGWSILATGGAVAISWSATPNGTPGGASMDVAGIAGFGGGCLAFGKTSKGCGFVTGAQPGSSEGYMAHVAGPGLTLINDPESGFLIPSSETITSVMAGVYARTGNVSSTYKTAAWRYEDISAVPVEVYIQRGDASCKSAGFIPGFMMLPMMDIGIYVRQKLYTLGMDGADYNSLRIQDISRFNTAADGYKYALPNITSGRTNLAQVVMTDNPEFW